MFKQIVIVTLVLLARSAVAVEIQPTWSAFGTEAIKGYLNAGLDNSGSGEGLTGQARYTSPDFLPDGRFLLCREQYKLPASRR